MPGLLRPANILTWGEAPPVILVQAIDSVVFFVVITILFAFIFKVLPGVPLHWGDATLGAICECVR
jgi:uncharacterized BrkB/YihY/UPF0761 family membrane protein